MRRHHTMDPMEMLFLGRGEKDAETLDLGADMR